MRNVTRELAARANAAASLDIDALASKLYDRLIGDCTVWPTLADFRDGVRAILPDIIEECARAAAGDAEEWTEIEASEHVRHVHLLYLCGRIGARDAIRALVQEKNHEPHYR